MKTITFYSYKGGVGRSLTLSNIATRLADLGKKVCIIDFDLEAPGLHLKFKKYINQSQIKNGLVEYICDFQNDNFIPKKINNYISNISYKGTLNGSISLIPAGNINHNAYWSKLSSINWKDLFYSEESYGVNLLLHLKELIKKDLNPDYILIDSRTGITDISGIAMTLLSDTVVTLAANNDENIIGTSKVIRSLLNDENNIKGKLPEIHFVLSRIPYYKNPDKKHIENKIINNALNLLNRDGKILEEIFVIHSDRELEEEEKFKINQISNSFSIDEYGVPIEEDYLTLFESLTEGDLTDDEIIKFYNLRESELLIEEAKGSKDNAVKINLLKEAIELNNKSHEAFALLAKTYIDLYSFEKALVNIKSAIRLNKSNDSYLYYKAICVNNLNRVEESIEILQSILDRNEFHLGSLSFMGIINYKAKKFEKALEYQLKVVKYYSNLSYAYNSVGNTYRAMGNYEKAFEYVYKCLELDPKNAFGTGTLAEIYGELNNDEEFFKNLQLSFVFGMNSHDFQRIVNEESVYQKYFNNNRFLSLIKSYRMKINLEDKLNKK